MTVTAEMVRDLREKTGAGLMDCKRALSESSGDMDKAIEILRQKGLATAAKKAGRTASEGLVSSYIHMDKIGVLIEMNCETDFVARTEDFRALVKDVAMQIAASSPVYVSRDDVPAGIIEKEKEIYRAQITNKPPQVVEKIVEGKLEKFFSDTCLLDQLYIKDTEQKMKVKDLVTERISKFGENIIVRRFARFQLGEGVEKTPSC